MDSPAYAYRTNQQRNGNWDCEEQKFQGPRTIIRRKAKKTLDEGHGWDTSLVHHSAVRALAPAYAYNVPSFEPAGARRISASVATARFASGTGVDAYPTTIPLRNGSFKK